MASSRVEQIGEATLYLGDCLEVMSTLADGAAEIAFTSPPYNLGEGMEDKGGLRVGHSGSKWGDRKLREGYGAYADNLPYPDYVAWQRAVLDQLWRTCSGAIFYNHKPRLVGYCGVLDLEDDKTYADEWCIDFSARAALDQGRGGE